MAIPYRQFTRFEVATLEAYWDPPDWSTVGDWTSTHYSYGILGDYDTGGARDWKWMTIFRGSENERFESRTGMDEIMHLEFDYLIGVDSDTANTTSVRNVVGIIDDVGTWIKGIVTGKHYDGENEWANFPPTIQGDYEIVTLTIANLPECYNQHIGAWEGGVGANANTYQSEFWANGLRFYLSNYTPSVGAGEQCKLSMVPQSLKIKFFNPVVNSLSRYAMPTAGGVALVLTGLGLDNSDAEIDDGGDAKPGGWGDEVDEIHFEGLQGQGTTTLTRIGADFTVDSNTQITIAAMPALAKGTYNINVIKKNVPLIVVRDVSAYAGDWRTDSNGMAIEGSRITFTASDDYDEVGDFRQPGGDASEPILFTKWTFKTKTGTEAFKYYSFYDTQGPETFYDGRLLSVSSFSRSIDDYYGLFQVSDVTVELANTDQEFSELLATYIMKNQPVDMFFSWGYQPEGLKTRVHKLIVDDYSMDGPKFWAYLKDISQKYFQIRTPLYTISADDYANAHENAKGKPMPEVLGVNALLTTELAEAGAVEAHCVDTASFIYLAARGSLHSISKVYADGVEVAGGNWSVNYADGGITYITFTGDQGDSKITYDCNGYMFDDWDSTNGFVENPAYIILFYLAFIMEVPINFIDVDSFDDLATLYDDLGYEETGRLIIQDYKKADEVLRELVYSYGCNLYFSLDGKLKIKRFDISSFSTSLIAYEQIDLLQPAQRSENLPIAFNYMRSRYDYYPTANFYKSDKTDLRQPSIDDFEAKIERSEGADMPWIRASSSFVQLRQNEELLRYAYGDKKLKISLPIEWIDQLDILTVFKYQDPYGLSSTGAGEAGRYYYVSSINYDMEGNKLDVEAIDLQWLLRQYCIVGDETTLAGNWTTALEADRLYCYACNEPNGKFSDGEPGKKLADENAF